MAAAKALVEADVATRLSTLSDGIDAVTGLADKIARLQKVRVILEQMRRGGPLASFAPELARGVRFHVLGLTANSGRLVDRYRYVNTFGALTEHYQHYLAETTLEKDARLSLFTLFSAVTKAGDASRVPRPLAADLLPKISPPPLALSSPAKNIRCRSFPWL